MRNILISMRLIASLIFMSSCSAGDSRVEENSEMLRIESLDKSLKNKSENIVGNKNISLEQKIGQMLMVGFFGTNAKPNSKICKAIQKYNLGGVILFDYNPVNKSKAKNIYSKNQLAQLTQELQACSINNDLLIAVDQEGGKVQRLKNKYGFYGKFPKASEIVHRESTVISHIYNKMGKELQEVGINFNLAPVVDLAINPKNIVINKLGRSFGETPENVVRYTSLFIDAMHQNGIFTSLKHFPGHGSSLGDTHKGFVDVTKQWRDIELEPYRRLIAQGNVDTIMVAHVFNEHLDADYPASLSRYTITGVLRRSLHYQGVVITDDLQMGAINKKYGLKETLKLAINAGNDILLFGNQLNPKDVVSVKSLIKHIAAMIESNEINIETINDAYFRIQELKL